jgi:glycosyltransferase involved in cell wall biosynthesis
MRIAINGYYWGQPTIGSGQYVRSLVKSMAQINPENEYVIVVPRENALSDEIAPLPDFGAHVFLYPERPSFRVSENLAKLNFEQSAFPRACQREHVDVAHVPYFASPSNPPVPTVVTVHDLIPMILPLYRGSILVQMYTQLAARAARHAHAVIADSECTKRDIIARLGIDSGHVHTIYLAADARFRRIDDPAQVAEMRKRLDLPEKFLLYLGGYDQRKNIRAIIEAFSLLPELYEEGYRLVLGGVTRGAGSSDLFPDPRRIVSQSGMKEDGVQFLGWVSEEDKPAVYSSATLFLFPSLYEGFGLPPLEAMASGTPVISSNASSLPEIVGDAAMLVEPEAAVAWAESIRIVVSDPPRLTRMRERGIAQARLFSWQRTARETLAVYESIR